MVEDRLKPIIQDLRETYDLDAPDEVIEPQAEGVLSMLEDLHGQEFSREDVEAFFDDDGEPYTGVAL